MKKNLIQQINKQNNETIGSFLNSLCRQGFYTEYTDNLTPMLHRKDSYIVGTNEQIIAILIDKERPWESSTLCDEEKFCDDKDPLWFEESCHRVSPVYRLMQFAHAFRQLCRIVGKMQPSIHCVLITQTNLLNYDDQKPLYDFLGVTIFHHLPNLDSFDMVTGSGKDTPAARFMEDYRKHFDVLSWEPDKHFDYTAEEYAKEAAALDTTPKNNDANESSNNNDLSLFDFEEDLPEDCNNDWPEMGALRAELVTPMRRHEALRQLNSLVGCKQLKQFISDMCSISEYNRRLAKADSKAHPINQNFNLIFTGNPGTAKSTVARLMGSLLKGKVLSRGHVIMASRSTFVGRQWGMEEERVDRLWEMSSGGVLVIDEAYLLMGTGHREDPAKLVLPLMLSKLADERMNSNRMVVLCGYHKPMMQLIESNPGLASRFPHANRFEFKDLNVNELEEIFNRRILDYGEYRLTRRAREMIREAFSEVYNHRDKSTFGNGRYVVNIINGIMREHSRRVVVNNISERDKLFLITAADVKTHGLSVSERKRTIGFR